VAQKYNFSNEIVIINIVDISTVLLETVEFERTSSSPGLCCDLCQLVVVSSRHLFVNFNQTHLWPVSVFWIRLDICLSTSTRHTCDLCQCSGFVSTFVCQLQPVLDSARHVFVNFNQIHLWPVSTRSGFSKTFVCQPETDLQDHHLDIDLVSK